MSAKVHKRMAMLAPCLQAFDTDAMAVTDRSDTIAKWLSLAEFLPACVGRPRYMDL